MARGILYVESRPKSAERDDEYNSWYDRHHLPEVVALPGVVAARRFKPAGDDGPYVAIYEPDADDLAAVVDDLFVRVGSGDFAMSDALQTNPPPSFRLLELTASYGPTAH